MRADLNLFTVFEAIYAEGNLTRAAAILNLTQPAVSHALARLRVQFDDPLFVRQGNKMLPTAIAKNMIADTRKALLQLQTIMQQSNQFDPLTTKKVYALSLHDSLEASYIPYLMNCINKDAPKSSLVSTWVKRNELERKLASGDVDLAIDVLLSVDDSICHTQIRKDHFVVVAAKGHPALCKGVSLEGYLAQKHILVSSRASGAGLEDFELGKLGLYRRVGLRCRHFYSACIAVEGSDMLLTMPAMSAKIFVSQLNVTIHPLPVELPEIGIHLYWHSSVENDSINTWLRNRIIEAG